MINAAKNITHDLFQFQVLFAAQVRQLHRHIHRSFWKVGFNWMSVPRERARPASRFIWKRVHPGACPGGGNLGLRREESSTSVCSTSVKDLIPSAAGFLPGKGPAMTLTWCWVNARASLDCVWFACLHPRSPWKGSEGFRFARCLLWTIPSMLPAASLSRAKYLPDMQFSFDFSQNVDNYLCKYCCRNRACLFLEFFTWSKRGRNRESCRRGLFLWQRLNVYHNCLPKSLGVSRYAPQGLTWCALGYGPN